MNEEQESRCSTCGALLAADAEWCGQCFTPVRTREPEPDPAAEPALVSARTDPQAPIGESSEAPAKRATWTCPTCESVNTIEADVCTTCGTPFGAIFHQVDKPVAVAPKDAFVRSLLCPGLGHKMVGRGLDGIARASLFWWLFLTTILILVSGVSSGPMAGMLALFGLSALAIYLFTAFEAYRMAQGSGPLVSSRTLLWAAVGMVITSVLMAALIITAAAKR